MRCGRKRAREVAPRGKGISTLEQTSAEQLHGYKFWSHTPAEYFCLIFDQEAGKIFGIRRMAKSNILDLNYYFNEKLPLLKATSY